MLSIQEKTPFVLATGGIAGAGSKEAAGVALAFESPLTRARCEDSLTQRSRTLSASGTFWDGDTRVTIKYRP